MGDDCEEVLYGEYGLFEHLYFLFLIVSGQHTNAKQKSWTSKKGTKMSNLLNFIALKDEPFNDFCCC